MATVQIKKIDLREGKVWVSGKKGLYQAVPNGYSLLCGYQKSDRYLVSIDCDSSQALSQFKGMNFPTTVSYSCGRPGRSLFIE